jgi:hypothetical protein
MNDQTPRVPDPGVDDDPRIRAAVIAFAERELADLSFEPVVPTRRSPGRAVIALAGVAAAALLVVPLVGDQLNQAPIPAGPAPSAEAGLAQCLAGLTTEDIVPGSAKLALGDLRIVGYVVTRYSDADVSDLSDDLATFARTCHTLV